MDSPVRGAERLSAAPGAQVGFRVRWSQNREKLLRRGCDMLGLDTQL